MSDMIKAARKALGMGTAYVFDPKDLTALRDWVCLNEGRSVFTPLPHGLRVGYRGIIIAGISLYTRVGGGDVISSIAEFERYNRKTLKVLDFMANPRVDTQCVADGCRFIRDGLALVTQGRALLKKSGMPRSVASVLGKKGVMK